MSDIDESIFIEFLDATCSYLANLPSNYYREEQWETYKQAFIDKDVKFFSNFNAHWSLQDKLKTIIHNRRETAFFLLKRCWATYINSVESVHEQTRPTKLLCSTACEKLLNISEETIFNEIKKYSEHYYKSNNHNRWDYLWWRVITGYQEEWLKRQAEAESYFKKEREKYATGPSYIQTLQENARIERNKRDVEQSIRNYNERQRQMFGDFWFTISRDVREYRASLLK